MIPSAPLTFPVAINAGGPAVNGFLADQLWGPTVEYGHQDGYEGKYAASLDILDTEQDSVYRTELKEVVEYLVRVPPGRYQRRFCLRKIIIKQSTAAIRCLGAG